MEGIKRLFDNRMELDFTIPFGVVRPPIRGDRPPLSETLDPFSLRFFMGGNLIGPRDFLVINICLTSDPNYYLVSSFELSFEDYPEPIIIIFR